MGATVSAGANNDELVDNLLEADYIKTAAVERVFRAVDRAHYFTVDFKHNAYKDLAWKYGNLHISAPSIYSEVMENLNLAPGLSFLNLGSGTGYLSTMAGLILGSNGVNHGIEIYEDVTNYAKKKLEEFCSTSPALDEYEFCQPKFINGNCLNLDSEARQYDRVYCGVACPENHENYMKNLIKVGGILVMPINNQLLQIYRISETIWETKSVLPVSFASLISSNVSNASEPLKMPDFDPHSLQDLCRLTVRSILRRKIDLEHPELKKAPSRSPRKKIIGKTLRKLVLPIFGSRSDSEDNDIETEERTEARGSGRRRLVMDVQRLRSRSRRTLLELSQLLPGPSRREYMLTDEDIDDTHVFGSVMEFSQCFGSFDIDSVEAEVRCLEEGDVCCQQNKAKREKFDSGIVEDMESGRIGSSDSENEGDSVADKNFHADESLFKKSKDSDTETAMSDDASSKIEGNENEEKNEEPEKNYSTYMKEKIRLLPLPMTLKYFVNLDREL